MKYFGTDGFRGKVNEVLTVEHALKIGRYLGYYYSKEGRPARCVIGKDTRHSSYMLEYALSAGIASMGGDVYLLHVTTTPNVSYIAASEKFDCGIMITASHNPYTDNGIKIIDGTGTKMNEQLLIDIEKYIDGEITLEEAKDTGKIQDYLMGRNKYMGYLSSIPSSSFRGYKVALDTSNGSSYTIAKNVFEMLGADVTIISNTPDGYNINRDCGSTHIEGLMQCVKENHCDIGFAYDGDADRCLAVDEKGEVIDGDGIMFILSGYLKNHGILNGDTVVATIMSNIGLEKALSDNGIALRRTDVGDKYVSAELQKDNLSLGGEQSGHIIISKYATTGDGILTSLVLMEALIESKNTASALHGAFVVYPQKMINVVTDKKDAIVKEPEVLDYIAKKNEELKGIGRILIRKSGTEPKIRIMTEARSEKECDDLIAEAKAMIEKYL